MAHLEEVPLAKKGESTLIWKGGGHIYMEVKENYSITFASEEGIQSCIIRHSQKNDYSPRTLMSTT